MKNRVALNAHETSHQYLTSVLNGRTTVPSATWKSEREKLRSERYELCDKYFSLKADVKSVESLRRGAERFMGDIAPERKAVKVQKVSNENIVR